MNLKAVILLPLLILTDVCRAQDTIPFTLTEHNNIIFKTALGNGDSLDLMFDTGATGLLLTHEAIAEKTSLLQQGESTENYLPLEGLVELHIGNLTYSDLEIYPVTHSGQGSDGRFGWDLFADKVLELNYSGSFMVLSDVLPTDLSEYSSLSIRDTSTLFTITASLIEGPDQFEFDFLFDSGYQRALLLDLNLLKDQNISLSYPLIKENKLRNGAGDVFTTQVVLCESFMVNNFTLDSIPAQAIDLPNPAGFKVHILGNELLKRFDTIFDFPNRQIHIKPNQHSGECYTDLN